MVLLRRTGLALMCAWLLCGETIAAGATLAAVLITSMPGWSLSGAAQPGGARFQALAQDPGALPTRPRASRAIGLSHGTERATVLYLEYGSEAEARRALGELRSRLWGGDAAPPEGPRLLRAANLVAVIEAPTLAVPLAVSRRLAAAGAMQDGADLGDEGEASAAGTVPPPEASAPPPPPAESDTREQVAAGLGRYLDQSVRANQLLQQGDHAAALPAFRKYFKAVETDRAAPALARWDAAEGLGLAAAGSSRMTEARGAFTLALHAAARLDARKQAESAFNLACAEAELGHRDAALAVLRGCLAAARRAGAEREEHFRGVITTDPSLRSLQGDPQLKKLLAGP